MNQIDISTDDEKTLMEAAVIDYLQQHSDFFTRHPQVLAGLSAPERNHGDGIVDMQRFLLERRAEEMEEMRDCALEVIETSRSNMSTQTRTHAATLAAIGTNTLDALIHIINNDLPFLLDVDVVCLGLENNVTTLHGHQDNTWMNLDHGTIDLIMNSDEHIHLSRSLSDFDKALFGEASALVQSAAFARLRPGNDLPEWVLMLGSRTDAFHPGQGTELISFLARVLEASLSRLLAPPR